MTWNNTNINTVYAPKKRRLVSEFNGLLAWTFCLRYTATYKSTMHTHIQNRAPKYNRNMQQQQISWIIANKLQNLMYLHCFFVHELFFSLSLFFWFEDFKSISTKELCFSSRHFTFPQSEFRLLQRLNFRSVFHHTLIMLLVLWNCSCCLLCCCCPGTHQMKKNQIHWHKDKKWVTQLVKVNLTGFLWKSAWQRKMLSDGRGSSNE